MAAFGVQAPVCLVHEFDSTVIFPSENSEKFNAFFAGSTYEVQGASGNLPQVQVQGYPPSPSPFGAYLAVQPYLPAASRPPPSVPVQATKQIRQLIRKSIQVASFSPCDPDTPCTSRSSKMLHTVVTQVIVTLDTANHECNVCTVAEKMKKQLGFSVVLLDSKLFPLIDNESTTGAGFWKSTRKIIATSRSAYEKAGGVLPGSELCLEDDNVEPEPKRQKTAKPDSMQEEAAVGVMQRLDNIDKKLSFITELQRPFECIVCCSAISSPMVVPCCQRIVECKQCVARWLESNDRCPLCSVPGRVREVMELKGIDDLLAVIKSTVQQQISTHPEPIADGERNSTHLEPADVEVITTESDSGDDFELPNYNVRQMRSE